MTAREETPSDQISFYCQDKPLMQEDGMTNNQRLESIQSKGNKIHNTFCMSIVFGVISSKRKAALPEPPTRQERLVFDFSEAKFLHLVATSIFPQPRQNSSNSHYICSRKARPRTASSSSSLPAQVPCDECTDRISLTVNHGDFYETQGRGHFPSGKATKEGDACFLVGCDRVPRFNCFYYLSDTD